MPSGKVHDWVTVSTAIAAIPMIQTQMESSLQPLAWIGVASYAFSGIWLSSDLDVESSAYRRWGPLRFLWWPYQKIVPHRSWISHGLGVGPLLRVLYLLTMLVLIAWLAIWGLGRLGLALQVDPRSWLLRLDEVWHTYRPELIAGCVGLIAGGAVHSLLDFGYSWLKRRF